MCRERLARLIAGAVDTFSLRLDGRLVLTEAATGNYAVTPVIAALAGADVIAFTRASRFGTVDEVVQQTRELADTVRPGLSLKVVTSLDDRLSIGRVDIVTNTGFLRPLDAAFVERLRDGCVIPLMWETWEFRPGEIDLEACRRKGIKVYGTNENDPRLRTKEYIGFVVLERLLGLKRTPLSTRVLLLGSAEFTGPVQPLLAAAGYQCRAATVDEHVSADEFDAVVLLEHKVRVELVGSERALIPASTLRPDQAVIHVCGEADLSAAPCATDPDSPAPFGFMSYTTDHADPKAVVDLHAAGLSVAEGMLRASEQGLSGADYKHFVETRFPGQAFTEPQYW